MSRLASFKGPSTPTSSPVRAGHQSVPASPSRSSESTYHRKVRTLLQDMASTADTWDDIVLIDGLKAARGLVDTRTDLDNELATLSSKTLPTYHVVGPKLSVMENRILDLDNVLLKLKKQFQKMNNIVDSLEALLAEAHKTKGWKWAQEPLWATWSLEKFACSLPDILIPYHRSLDMHSDIANTLRSHSVTFEASREAIAMWAAQPYLEDGSWEAHWEDLCTVEIDRWDGPK
ncbi:hypothetical protein IEO21_01598 [Rhodonia placenta]|uniref:Uncharacterized protein n=1 Tax=Rhodonia placenta TaxID=104341 RepID=A0A8H7P970_9APHY|nr:hypothetical protein IEO21_01598 [Postia placenta]